MQVVACSPLTKLFLPEWEEALLEEPDLILDDTLEFMFTVDRAVGAIENVKYGVPFRADDYLKGSGEGKAGEDLLHYLTGGKRVGSIPETDWTGIVKIDTPRGIEVAQSEIQAMILRAQVSGDAAKLAEAHERMKQIYDESFVHTKAAMKTSRAQADARVMLQLKITHNNLMKQYAHNKDDGKGMYAPSTREHFGAYVIRKMINISKGRRTMTAEFNKIINDIQAQ